MGEQAERFKWTLRDMKVSGRKEEGAGALSSRGSRAELRVSGSSGRSAPCSPGCSEPPSIPGPLGIIGVLSFQEVGGWMSPQPRGGDPEPGAGYLGVEG